MSVGVKETELVPGGVVVGPGNQVLSTLDHTAFDGVNVTSGAMGGMGAGMGNHAGILDPSTMGGNGPFSSPVGPDYSNMATSMPMDSPSILPGPQPQNFPDSQVSGSALFGLAAKEPLFCQSLIPR